MVLKVLTKIDDNSRINFIILALAILSVAASFFGNWRLWGVDFVELLPLPLQLIILGLLVILAIPPLNAAIGRRLSRVLSSLSRIQLTMLYVAIAAGLAVMFVVFKCGNQFLGDGYNIMGNIRIGHYFSPTEPLDYLVHYAVFKTIRFYDRAAYYSYAYSSYACGILLLAILFAFIKNKVNLILSLGVVITFSAFQFFFGYVENYTFSFIFMLCYSLSAIRDLNRNRLSIITVILLVLACAFQLSCISLIPSLVFLAFMKFPARKRYIIMIAVIAAGGLAMAAYLLLFSEVPLAGIFVPFLKKPDNPYTFFSGAHLSDLANIFLLNFPLLLAAAFIGRLRNKLINPFYLVLLGPALLYTIFVDPKLGAFRDWDMLSLSSGPLLAFFIDSFFLDKGRKDTWNPSVFVALGLFGILHTGAWIYLNSQSEDAYLTVREEVKRDIHYSRDYLGGYRNKSWGTLVGKYTDDRPEVIRAAMERFYGAPDDTVATSQLIEAFVWAGDTLAGVDWALKYRYRFATNLYAATTLSKVLTIARRYPEAEQICYNYLSNVGGAPEIYYNLAGLKGLQNQDDSSYYYYDQAYKIWPTVSVDKQFNLYLECVINGYNDLAQSGLERILPALNVQQRQYTLGLLNTLKSKNAASIDSVRDILLKNSR